MSTGIDPGRLDRRLVLEAPVETPDGAGGVTRGYVGVATVWAEVTPLSSRSDEVAGARGATVTHPVLLRAGPAITARHRLRDGARLFTIVSIRTADAHLLDLQVEERVE